MRKMLLALSLTLALPGLATAQGGPTAPPATTLRLTFEADGTVTLAAANVTARDVLAEWARRCGCFVVNAQNLPGAAFPVPVQFDHAPQGVVLESLLRQASGYTLTPRRPGATGASAFETIYIVPTSQASQTAYVPPPMTSPAIQVSPASPGSPDDELPPVIPAILRADPGNQPPQQATPAQAPATPPGQTPRPPTSGGTPGVFVPIVPVGSPSAAPRPGSTAPGTVTPAAGTSGR